MVSRVDRNLAQLTAKEAKKFVKRIPPPWKRHMRGRPPKHDSRTVFVLCLLMVTLNLTYDSMASEMRKGYLEKILEVKNLPSRSVLNRGMLRLNQKYVRKFNKLLVRKFLRKGTTIIVDSTGIRLRTSSSWYDIRIGRKNRRRDNAKFHIAIEVSRNMIVEYKITSWKRNDSPYLKFLLRNVEEVLRVLADAGYPSRQNCNIVVQKNGKPFFRLKKDATAKAKGSVGWRWMVNFARRRKELYDQIYGIRSVIEGIMSAIKRRYGNSVRAIKRKTRNISIALRVIAFNIKQRLYDKTARRLGLPFWVATR
ncbi:MAG: transposase [Candidatus Micrarchaeaceae archaeon]